MSSVTASCSAFQSSTATGKTGHSPACEYSTTEVNRRFEQGSLSGAAANLARASERESARKVGCALDRRRGMMRSCWVGQCERWPSPAWCRVARYERFVFAELELREFCRRLAALRGKLCGHLGLADGFFDFW